MTPRLAIYITESAYWHGVEPSEIMSHSRRKPVCDARRAVMRQLRADGFTTTQIGRWLGRDHTTVVHGLRARV